MNKKLLEYFCKTTYDIIKVPMFLFRKDSDELDLSTFPLGEQSQMFMNDKNFYSKYSGRNLFSTEAMVSYYISDDNLAFGCVNDLKSYYAIYIGPCMLSELNRDLMNSMLNRYNSPFKKNPEKYYSLIHQYLQELPRMSEEQFMALLTYVNSYVNNTITEPSDFFASSISKRQLTMQEKKIPETTENTRESFDLLRTTANNLITLVRGGNEEEVKRYWLQLKDSNPLFTLDSSSSINIMRQYKNSFIQLAVTIATVLVIDGISEWRCTEITAKHIAAIENVLTYRQIEPICLEMLHDFTQLVSQHRTEAVDNSLIRKVIEYINSHIYYPISSEDIAENLHISRGYLSNLFNATMNMSLPEYINRQKIELAKNLLKSTDTSIVDISNYLSFSSQPYFQHQFKKITGMTPAAYRRKS